MENFNVVVRIAGGRTWATRTPVPSAAMAGERAQAWLTRGVQTEDGYVYPDTIESVSVEREKLELVEVLPSRSRRHRQGGPTR